MMLSRHVLPLLPLLLLSLSACGPAGPSITLSQGDRTWTIQPGVRARLGLDSEPFVIGARLRPYEADTKDFHSLKLIATADIAILGTTRTGISTEVAQRFAPGSGYAPVPERGWPILGAEGFNVYWYDPGDPGGSTLLPRDSKAAPVDGEYDLYARIDGFFTDERLVALESWGRRPVALVIFLDRNLDGYIDRGELYEALLSFTGP
jgi:hypothetical protein